MEAIQSFIDQLARMQWSDYLDIVLVAFLIYKLLPLIRTPSTMRMKSPPNRDMNQRLNGQPTHLPPLT